MKLKLRSRTDSQRLAKQQVGIDAFSQVPYKSFQRWPTEVEFVTPNAPTTYDAARDF
jgi:hypothetical protein